MDKELLTKAASGDTAALATLRRTTPTNLTVFVAPGSKLDITATLAAFKYYKLHNTPPDEWEDEPTLTFAQAFPVKIKRNPLTLKPITPGLWTRLWDKSDGHELCAAIWWGRQASHIVDTNPAIKVKVRAHLRGTEWALLLEVVKMMRRDERQCQHAMDAVNAPVEQIVSRQIITADVVPGVEKRAGLQAALATLEREHDSGMIDIGRYMRLEQRLTAELHASYGSKWSHQRYVALRDFIITAYSLDDLKVLCLQVGLRYDDLGGGGLSSKVLSLVNNRQRRGLLDEVGALCKKQRPAIWSRMME